MSKKQIFPWLFVLLAAMSLIACADMDDRIPTIVFPDDPTVVLDVKRDFGAAGDGLADDTDALQSAIENSRGVDHSRVIYLPEGIYRITRPLVFTPPGDELHGSMVGPWIYGQHRDRTIIRLDDGAVGFSDPDHPLEAIRGIPRPDGAPMNADFFNRILVNLTIDTGDNPGATGIKFYSNNTGLMRHVRIIGNGVCGIDLGFLDQNGPLLLQDVEVDGFATGISTARSINSQTLSRIHIRARQTGLYHQNQMLAAEALEIIAPQPIVSHNGVLTLLDSRLTASGKNKGPAAIKLTAGHLFADAIITKGFAKALEVTDIPGGDVSSSDIYAYSSHNVESVGISSQFVFKRQSAPVEPDLVYPNDSMQWLSVSDFGAKPGDTIDDTQAFQRAFDEAASRGISTVYIPCGAAPDPNWYLLNGTIRVHGSVNRVMGFGMVRLIRNGEMSGEYPENLPRFLVDSEPGAAPLIIFENMQPFSPSPSFAIEVKCPNRTVVTRSTGGLLIVREGATAFISDNVGLIWQEKGSKVYGRQYNTEGNRMHHVNSHNDGGLLWILGMKTEESTTKIATINGGKTEVYGVLNYNTHGVSDEQDCPFFLVENASLSVAGYREIHYGNQWWRVPVRVVNNKTVKQHPPENWQTWSLLHAGDR